MTLLIKTRVDLVLFALGAMGLTALVLTGCGKKEEPPKADPSAPAVYMKDPVFRKELSEKRQELQAIVAERKPLADRMQELAREHNENLAELRKIPEWNELNEKVVALNAKYKAARQHQLKIVSDRLAPKKEISK